MKLVSLTLSGEVMHNTGYMSEVFLRGDDFDSAFYYFQKYSYIIIICYWVYMLGAVITL